MLETQTDFSKTATVSVDAQEIPTQYTATPLQEWQQGTFTDIEATLLAQYDWTQIAPERIQEIEQRLRAQNSPQASIVEIAKATLRSIEAANLRTEITFDPNHIRNGAEADTKIDTIEYWGIAHTALEIFLESLETDPYAYNWIIASISYDPVWLDNLPEKLTRLQERVFSLGLISAIRQNLISHSSPPIVMTENGVKYLGGLRDDIARLLPRTLLSFANAILEQIALDDGSLFPVNTLPTQIKENALYMLVKNLGVIIELAKQYSPDFLAHFRENPAIGHLFNCVSEMNCPNTASSPA